MRFGWRLEDGNVAWGGYSHKLGYAYAKTARVWFLPIYVLEGVGGLSVPS